jgi:hypothetical protein
MAPASRLCLGIRKDQQIAGETPALRNRRGSSDRLRVRREFSVRRVYSNRQEKQPKERFLTIGSQGIAMKTRFIVAWFLTCSVLCAAGPLFAHHSSSSYDMEHQVNMKGVVSNVEWTNPHVFIFLDVKDDNGSADEWRVEGNSPNMLTRVGWKKEMIKAGDTLVVNGAPAKNGSKIMRLISVTLASGQKLDGQGFK